MLKNKKTNRRLRQARKRTLGTVAVEMAVVLPAFLIIFFGFIEIARLSFAVNSAKVALIKSARSLSLPDATAEDGREAALDYLQKVGFDTETININVTPTEFTTATSEITVEINFNLEPFPLPVRESITRSRE